MRKHLDLAQELRRILVSFWVLYCTEFLRGTHVRFHGSTTVQLTLPTRWALRGAPAGTHRRLASEG